MGFDHIFAVNTPIIVKNSNFCFFQKSTFLSVSWGSAWQTEIPRDKYYNKIDYSKWPSSEK